MCGRKILVQIALIGDSHNLGVSIVCGDCIRAGRVDREYKKHNPELAKEIEDWANDVKH